MMLIHGFVIYDHEDKCIYNKLNNNDCVIICLYVDDLYLELAIMLCMILNVFLPLNLI